VKGIWLMEQLYPLETGESMFSRDPKLKAELDKEVKKGAIRLPDPNKPIDVDDDQDAKIDDSVKEIWTYYDKKNLGFIDRKQARQFMEDALELFALRRGRKAKELVNPQLNMSKALDQAVDLLDAGKRGQVTFKEFEDFVNSLDLDEALAVVTGTTAPKDMAATVDPSKLVNVADIQASNPKKVIPGHIEYRNYEQSIDQ